MKQIKTIHLRIDESQKFDEEVNKALAEGWQLTKRDFVPNYCILYAELEKNTITEAERCCDNCAHCDNPGHALPCKVCIDASHWEEG